MNRKSLTYTAIALAAAVALTGCGKKEESTKTEKIITWAAEFDGFGANDEKALQGLAEAEQAVTKAFASGLTTKDIDFDFLNANMLRSAAIPSGASLGNFGGIEPVVSIDNARGLVISAQGEEGFCFYLKVSQTAPHFQRGLGIDQGCDASQIPEGTAWSPVGASDWPLPAEVGIPQWAIDQNKEAIEAAKLAASQKPAGTPDQTAPSGTGTTKP